MQKMLQVWSLCKVLPMPRAWDGKSPEFSRPQTWSKRVSFLGKFPNSISRKEDMLNNIKDQMAKMTEA
jgi:hypothetical protein